MEPIILHVAIDSFAIQAERLRCPKLLGRPIALAPPDGTRPRVVVASREAAAHGVLPGVPLVQARRLCRDLIALAPDVDLYAGLSDSIRDRLAPFAPLGGAPKPGRFVLDLTGVTPTHRQACGHAARAGSEVRRLFGLHPTLGVAATRLVSGIAASVLAPDGELLDVPTGSETAFLGPLAVRVLPTARGAFETGRLDLLNLRLVRDVQALEPRQLEAAVGRAAAVALWREARGLDGAAGRTDAPASAVAEETLAAETNDGRVLAARLERLAMEVAVGLRRRGTAAGRLLVGVTYADGRHGRARRRLTHPTSSEFALRDAAIATLEKAVTRRIRVRRIRLEVWENAPGATQLHLWSAASSTSGRDSALEGALDQLRGKFGTSVVVPGSWMALGVALRSSARS